MSTRARELRAKAAALRALADDLTAFADSIEETPVKNSALDLETLRARYGFSRESLQSAAKNGLAVHKGPRGKLMAFECDVESWIRARAWTPSSKRTEEHEHDALDRAEAELLAFSGSNTRPRKEKTAARARMTETPDSTSSDSAHLEVVR